MENLFKITYLILVLNAATVCQNQAYSQCAMCKSTVESNQKEDSQNAINKAQGLNTGILYLMVLPYVIFACIGYFWYKNSKKEREERQRMENILAKAITRE